MWLDVTWLAKSCVQVVYYVILLSLRLSCQTICALVLNACLQQELVTSYYWHYRAIPASDLGGQPISPGSTISLFGVAIFLSYLFMYSKLHIPSHTWPAIFAVVQV